MLTVHHLNQSRSQRIVWLFIEHTKQKSIKSGKVQLKKR